MDFTSSARVARGAATGARGGIAGGLVHASGVTEGQIACNTCEALPAFTPLCDGIAAALAAAYAAVEGRAELEVGGYLAE
jgi:hypothetical protein